MITIDIYHYAFSDELKESCIEFTESMIGSSKNLRIVKEDENDTESSYSVLFDYPDYNLDDFSKYLNPEILILQTKNFSSVKRNLVV